MKKILALTMAAAMSLTLFACGGGNNNNSGGASSKNDASSTNQSAVSSSAQDGDSSKYGSFTTVEPGKLHMSTNAAFPPYEMTTDAGGFEGIDVEVAAAIADKLGLELVVDDMGFDAALTAVQTGQSDIAMAGITITEERLEVMDFSDSYATGIQVVIVKEGSPIATVDDLANAEMIGTQKTTTGSIYCTDDYGVEHVTEFDTGALAVMALVNGQVDAVVIDNEPAKSFVAANEGLVILDTEYAVEDYAIGFAKGNTALKDAVNAAMAELQADGTFQAIVDSYITAE